MDGIPYDIALISDVPHILKNIRNALLNNDTFKIHDEYVEIFGLSTNEVRLSTIQKICELQKDMELKIAPHLKPSMVNKKMSSFERMRVKPARAVLSRKTANAIRFCVDHYPLHFNQDDITTAVFIEQIGDWYETMNNGKFELAFSKYKPEVYAECVTWLENFMYFFSSTKMHSSQHEDALKPTQKGVLMTTKSTVTLQKDLLNTGFKYVLSSRFSNDPKKILFDFSTN